ncbi:hypothetical protein GW590_18315 [Rahnella sp. SAP-1]|jgi:hypothetical protein|uniref:Uncharacterized protein n=1 Tax=Rouxiella aceris TaxID=2703884 RepID=A0A848MNR6_9GAMM|nr:hypothetical protein [Rouxiella aceris]NMP28816.1 hypothetical protein [Rouxiella aceris]
MALSINAWLQGKIDEYKFTVRDATVDYYMADAALKRPDADISQLKGYNSLCLDRANICLQNGDDPSYLHALCKLHNRLILEINNPQRNELFRIQSYHFARHTLKMICRYYAMMGIWDKATAFQTDFVKRVPFQL